MKKFRERSLAALLKPNGLRPRKTKGRKFRERSLAALLKHLRWALPHLHWVIIPRAIARGLIEASRASSSYALRSSNSASDRSRPY